jgi:uncharacterized protein YebE (UPF0316 family)
MESFFFSLGIDNNVFHYFILPFFIFLARVCDVSISTIRIMFVMNSKTFLAPLLGFFEALVWLLAIGQIIQNIDNIYSYLAYAGGFAVGTYVGMVFEEKLALGKVLVRVITQKEDSELLEYLKEKKFRFTNLDATGNSGRVNLLFTVIKREELPELIDKIKVYNPQAFYTVENVKRVSDDEKHFFQTENPQRRFRLLSLKRR